MYSLSQVRRGLQSPNLFLREINRLYHRKLNLRDHNTDGINIFEEDWDNLLLLDACRFDMFEQKCDFDGTLESRTSRGSATVEFLRGNVDGTDLRDTVYVTANPKLVEHKDDIDASFHAVINVWTDEWDNDHKTVLPEVVTEYAKEAAANYPNKRLFVHYVQPHYPFLTNGQNPFDNRQAFENPDEPGSWHHIMTGDISTTRETIWRAYIENLDRALPTVKEFLEDLPGLSVVTSDHGNMVGERAGPIPIREWGHPEGIYTEELVRVPWFIQEDGDRKVITKESHNASNDKIDDEIVESRLKNLGYRI